MKYGEIELVKSKYLRIKQQETRKWEWRAYCFEAAVGIKLDPGAFYIRAYDRPAKDRTGMKITWQGAGTRRWFVETASKRSGWFTPKMLDDLNIVPQKNRWFWIEIWQ